MEGFLLWLPHSRVSYLQIYMHAHNFSKFVISKFIYIFWMIQKCNEKCCSCTFFLNLIFHSILSNIKKTLCAPFLRFNFSFVQWSANSHVFARFYANSSILTQYKPQGCEFCNGFGSLKMQLKCCLCTLLILIFRSILNNMQKHFCTPFFSFNFKIVFNFIMICKNIYVHCKNFKDVFAFFGLENFKQNTTILPNFSVLFCIAQCTYQKNCKYMGSNVVTISVKIYPFMISVKSFVFQGFFISIDWLLQFLQIQLRLIFFLQ
eukprot:TRINITY_DN3136_c0_g1_i1.p1 TRINITY_DN3136_c0_g1~~TRINITY_DN3136_c0_g1_i1.p1  ORF type:complete len:262 (+),score=-4.85 TRINITY_DN3136_c0_g1_i1:150-935(+)